MRRCAVHVPERGKHIMLVATVMADVVNAKVQVNKMGKMLDAWRCRIVANANANIKRVQRAIDGPHGYQMFGIFEPLPDEELASRLESLRNELATYRKQIEEVMAIKNG